MRAGHHQPPCSLPHCHPQVPGAPHVTDPQTWVLKSGLHPCFHSLIIWLLAGMGELCSGDGGVSVCSEPSMNRHLLIVATYLATASTPLSSVHWPHINRYHVLLLYIKYTIIQTVYIMLNFSQMCEYMHCDHIHYVYAMPIHLDPAVWLYTLQKFQFSVPLWSHKGQLFSHCGWQEG